ncbi:hypothetical protein CERSUDRAFT_76663 [Gelatoporia subvermispora B]|uniref:Uncharacterized protein n=1 Tax=Ceriporiopsis subvermispora (strain B) TaxID=914234 RepID=M2R3G1_CERS8|nr:hypothetical protein CERSUDRAFT_76663 [Gelatoporia subvermispora B]
MAPTKWLTKESNLLLGEYTSEAVRCVLRSEVPGYQRKAGNMIAAEYCLKFSEPFDDETEAEFDLRKASMKSDQGRENLERGKAETPEDCEQRIAEQQRIYNWVKNRSEKRQARPPALIKPERRARRITGWDIFKRERGSQKTVDDAGGIKAWTAAIHTEYHSMDPDKRGEYDTRAEQEQKERDKAAELGDGSANLSEEERRELERIRIKHVARIDATVAGTLKNWLKLTGMVSITLFGCVDQYGELHAGIKCAGVDKDGRTFEQRLIIERNLFRDRLCNYFEEFVFDCYEDDNSHSGAERKVRWDAPIGSTASTARSSKAGVGTKTDTNVSAKTDMSASAKTDTDASVTSETSTSVTSDTSASATSDTDTAPAVPRTPAKAVASSPVSSEATPKPPAVTKSRTKDASAKL